MTDLPKPDRPLHAVIAGGSGFLGRGLARTLRDAGWRVTVLSRSGAGVGAVDGVSWRIWDGRTPGDWVAALDGAQAVINLVGRSVDCRKTPANRAMILSSRVASCRVLGMAMRRLASPPPVWIQGSTAHIVGDPVPEDTVCDESTPPGTGLAPEVGLAWEEAFDAARLPSQRGVVLRISFVLGRDGGALARLAAITRLGLGGTVGSGRQWVSWIHQADLNRLVLAMLGDPAFRGVYMVTAPNPVTNRCFMAALRRACRRPWCPPAPALGVRLVSRFVMNTDPELALRGRRCVPTRLLDQGRFSFDFPDVQPALDDLLDKEA